MSKSELGMRSCTLSVRLTSLLCELRIFDSDYETLDSYSPRKVRLV
jgi:hypothetical protein